MNKFLINKLVSMVNEYENNGIYKKADKINSLMIKLAQAGTGPFYDPNNKFNKAGQELREQHNVTPASLLGGALLGNLNQMYTPGQKGTLMPNGQFVPDAANAPQSTQTGQPGQLTGQQANQPQQPQNQPQMANTGPDTSQGYVRRQQPEFYKNIAKDIYSKYVSSGYNPRMAQSMTLQYVSQAMQKNMEIPYYHNILLNEINNSFPKVTMQEYKPANSLNNMDPFAARYRQELQQQKAEQQQEQNQNNINSTMQGG